MAQARTSHKRPASAPACRPVLTRCPHDAHTMPTRCPHTRARSGNTGELPPADFSSGDPSQQAALGYAHSF
eukprot:2403550-Prymnesium_polylepis.1